MQRDCRMNTWVTKWNTCPCTDIINRADSFLPHHSRKQKQINDNYNKKNNNSTMAESVRTADYEHVQLLIYTWHRGKKIQPSLRKNVARDAKGKGCLARLACCILFFNRTLRFVFSRDAFLFFNNTIPLLRIVF